MGILGDILGPVLGFIGGKEERQQSVETRDVQHQFQERMSSSAVSRHAADMENAGLNRILAAGGSASSPGGASFAAKNLLEGSVSSAIDMRRMKKEIELVDANVGLTKAKTQAELRGTIGRKLGGKTMDDIKSAMKAVYDRAVKTAPGKKLKYRFNEVFNAR